MSSTQNIFSHEPYMLPYSSSERSEHLYICKKTYKNFYFITVVCNKHPSKKIVSADEIMNCTQDSKYKLIDYCYELNSTCQLHTHALVGTNDVLYMKKVVAEHKQAFPDFSYRISKVPKEEIGKVLNYLKKSDKGDHYPRNLYYNLIKPYYENAILPLSISELADYGFEYNFNNDHLRYVDDTKSWFI